MMTFGRRLRVTVFGSSHGPEVGAEIQGVPEGTPIELSDLQRALDRRRPVGRRLATRRREEDRLVVETGVDGGRATGALVRLHVANTDVRRRDYDKLRNTPRPGHADFPARARFGPDADLSGGGIFSGRMTVGLVAAGAIGAAIVRPLGVETVGFTRAIAGISAKVPESMAAETLRTRRDANEVGCPAPATAARMEAAIAAARRDGDSVGGIVEVRAFGTPVGLGEPFFDSIESAVAHLAFSVPGVKGVEFGDGFRSAGVRGSRNNDPYDVVDGQVRPRTNHAGGVLGGLADGAPVVARFAIKPTPSIARRQTTVDLGTMRGVEIRVPGRHDPCIVPRAVVVLESVTAFALADLALSGGFVR